MLTHMLVQYVVGLCCLRRNPDAVHVELGDLVLDEASGKMRDVDVTVTIDDQSGESWAFKAFEVKDEKSPLDVGDVEQLCAKLNDMKAVTHRAIVSSSGFTDGAGSKAQHHGIELYSLEEWNTPVELEFPRFGLTGLPEEAIPFSRKLLVWVNSQYSFKLIVTAAQRSFSIENADALFDSAGDVHARYKTFGQYADEILLRSTEQLWDQEPAKTMGHTLPEFHGSGCSVTREWTHSHTLDVSADNVYLRVDDLVKLKMITISGYMRWETTHERPDFRVMRRVRDGEPFAGALIALGKREGNMIVFVMSDSRVMGIHFVQLEEKHLNMIRQLSLALP